MQKYTTFVALAVCAMALLRSTAVATDPSFIISVAAQRGRGQPYPRSVQNKAIKIAFGSGANKVSYSFTVDTGSGLLEPSCSSAAAAANCQGTKDLLTSYNLTADHMVSTAKGCAATGINCLVPGNASSTCFYSQALTGGTGMNGFKGSFAKDTVTVLDVTRSGTAQRLSLQAVFACAQATFYCAQGGSACQLAQQSCPTNTTPQSILMKGGCVKSRKGVEAGWTFNAGGSASAVALPEQVYRAGLIKNRVLGICWQRVQKDADCRADIVPNSATVLGPALPTGINLTTDLQVAPLNNATAVASQGGASPSTHTFRTNVTGISMAQFRSKTAWNTSFSGPRLPSVLWDTGAYGESIVPPPAFEAFMSYFDAASAEAYNGTKFSIQPCGAKAAAFCGANAPADAYACQRIALPAGSSPTTLAAAKRVLLGMYPPSIDIQLQGGAVAQLPAAFALNDCVGAPRFTKNAGVAVCSYVRPPPPGTGGQDYFWVAGPWFHGRFVQFDLGGMHPTVASPSGVVRFSGPLAACNFAAQ